MTNTTFPLYDPTTTTATQDPAQKAWDWGVPSGPDTPMAYATVVPAAATVPGVTRPVSQIDRTLAGIAHVSPFFTFLLGPALVRAIAPAGSFAKREAAKAFNFQLIAFIAAVVAGVVVDGILHVGDGLMALGFLAWFVMTIVGAVHAFKGEPWDNPVMKVVPWRPMDEK